MTPAPTEAQQALHRRLALRFVVGIGVVSLFADFTYEGGRSITGPYLALLGAGPLLVGFIAGAGEMLGYGLRWFSGRYADRSGHYWPVMYVGYAINLLALPLLAVVSSVAPAAGLIFAERLGKGLRNPARDAVLSEAGQTLGHGKVFGLHEALDQTGALIGPLCVAGAVAWSGYQLGFGILIVPAVVALFVLSRARGLQPSSAARRRPQPLQWNARYKRYLLFVVITLFGFAHFQIIAYHLAVSGVASGPTIPLLFALAMGADAVAALAAGLLFDRIGLAVLYVLPALIVVAAGLVFLASSLAAIAVGIAFWGAALGIQESVLRSCVARFAPPGSQGAAFGLFDTIFGAAWFAGSIAVGGLYSLSASAVVGLIVVSQIVAFTLLLYSRKLWRVEVTI